MSTIDGERLWRNIAEERAAKDLVISYMEEVDLSVREDTARKLFGRLEGRPETDIMPESA